MLVKGGPKLRLPGYSQYSSTASKTGSTSGIHPHPGLRLRAEVWSHLE